MNTMHKRSRVLMWGSWGKVTLSIDGRRVSRKQRRQIALALLKGMAENVRGLNGRLWHDDGAAPRAGEEWQEMKFGAAPDPSTPEGRFGFEIRWARLERGLSQEELALRAGLSANHLSAIERGKVSPRELTRARIERALKD